MKPILLVAGTRPELIKLAPIIKSLRKQEIKYVFVWSGQHYDFELSDLFFDELRIAEPDERLNVGSGTHAVQTAKIMVGLEAIIRKRLPESVVAEGDTNTVLASSLTAVKCHVPFAHVEAGLRSWDPVMPEEINRKVADSIASIDFAPTRLSAINLLFEGASKRSVYVTGNTIVDAIYSCKNLLTKREKDLLSKFEVDANEYVLVTVHRAENTDNTYRLLSIVRALKRLAKNYKVVFPMHPRTKSELQQVGLLRHLRGVKIMKPLGYLNFLSLLKNCRTVLTDSGGVQEEAFTLRVPAVTLRYSTERPETTMYGMNKLSGTETRVIVKTATEQANYAARARRLEFKNPFGEGHAGEKITRILCEKRIKIVSPDFRKTPVIAYSLAKATKPLSRGTEILVGFNKIGDPRLPFDRDTIKLLIRCRRNKIHLGEIGP
jgi:UDP-N-acetylglucosamine 2-epimerase (non-hydrolysing)